jgi:hypothetical protein
LYQISLKRIEILLEFNLMFYHIISMYKHMDHLWTVLCAKHMDNPWALCNVVHMSLKRWTKSTHLQKTHSSFHHLSVCVATHLHLHLHNCTQIYLELEHRLVQILTFHHHCALLASAFESFMFPLTIGGSTPHSSQQFYELKRGGKLNWCRNICRFSLTSGHWSWNKQSILLLHSREELANPFEYICLQNGREKIQKNNFKANLMSVPSKQKHTWQGWVWSQTNLWVLLIQQWQKVAEWIAVNLLAIAPSLTSSAPDIDDYTVICSLSPANYYTKLYVLRILLHL